MPVIDIETIRKYLPHRYPFLLVDRVVQFESGKELTAIKNVTANEPFFSGHFPQGSVMPGVLIIESLAQAGGILTFITEDTFFNEKDWFFLAGIDNARFKKIVRPGDQLQLHVELIRARRELWKFKGTATVEGQLVCEAEILTARGNLRDSRS